MGWSSLFCAGATMGKKIDFLKIALAGKARQRLPEPQQDGGDRNHLHRADLFISSVLVVVFCAALYFGWTPLEAFVLGFTDTQISNALFAVWIIIPLLGFIMSIKSPDNAIWASVYIIAFIAVATFGYLLQLEQGARAEHAVIEQKQIQKKYDRDVGDLNGHIINLHGQIKGLQDTVGVIAKNFPDRKNWESFFSGISDIAKKSQPNVVMVEPASSGNLKQRALEMGTKLQDMIDDRTRMRNNIIVGPDNERPKQEEKWAQSNLSYYQWCCEKDLDGLIAEFKALHLADKDLDRVVWTIKEMEMHPSPPGWLGPLQMSALHDGIIRLANELQ